MAFCVSVVICGTLLVSFQLDLSPIRNNFQISKSVTVVTVIAPALRAAFFSASLPQMSKSFLVAKKLLAGGLQPCPPGREGYAQLAEVGQATRCIAHALPKFQQGDLKAAWLDWCGVDKPAPWGGGTTPKAVRACVGAISATLQLRLAFGAQSLSRRGCVLWK